MISNSVIPRGAWPFGSDQAPKLISPVSRSRPLSSCADARPRINASLSISGFRFSRSQGQWTRTGISTAPIIQTDRLSITHKLGSEDEAELDICEACETSPHDGVSRRRVFCTCQVAPEPSEFGGI